MPAALLVAALLPTPAAAASAPTNAAVAARIAGQLGCLAFAYYPGANSASSSQGQLDCQLKRQTFVVHVFADNRDRAKGIAHLKLWSGPDVYFFAKTRRAVIVPRGDFARRPFTKRWATIAADRTGGKVFSG